MGSEKRLSSEDERRLVLSLRSLVRMHRHLAEDAKSEEWTLKEENHREEVEYLERVIEFFTERADDA